MGQLAHRDLDRWSPNPHQPFFKDRMNHYSDAERVI
jgi:hypothetical protein